MGLGRTGSAVHPFNNLRQLVWLVAVVLCQLVINMTAEYADLREDSF